MADRKPDGKDEMGHGDELDSAREAILEADERATGSVQEQLESIEAGIFEEEGGERTRGEGGPKVDRIAEVAAKLDALADEAASDEEQPDAVGERIGAARDHVRRYLKAHPQGG